jgi:hypothetical protein
LERKGEKVLRMSVWEHSDFMLKDGWRN